MGIMRVTCRRGAAAAADLRAAGADWCGCGLEAAGWAHQWHTHNKHSLLKETVRQDARTSACAAAELCPPPRTWHWRLLAATLARSPPSAWSAAAQACCLRIGAADGRAGQSGGSSGAGSDSGSRGAAAGQRPLTAVHTAASCSPCVLKPVKARREAGAAMLLRCCCLGGPDCLRGAATTCDAAAEQRGGGDGRCRWPGGTGGSALVRG